MDVDEVWALPEDGKRYEVIDGELVDPDARVIERWTPDDDRPEILSERIEWRERPDEPPFTLELPPFFAGVCD